MGMSMYVYNLISVKTATKLQDEKEKKQKNMITSC